MILRIHGALACVEFNSVSEHCHQWTRASFVFKELDAGFNKNGWVFWILEIFGYEYGRDALWLSGMRINHGWKQSHRIYCRRVCSSWIVMRWGTIWCEGLALRKWRKISYFELNGDIGTSFVQVHQSQFWECNDCREKLKRQSFRILHERHWHMQSWSTISSGTTHINKSWTKYVHYP